MTTTELPGRRAEQPDAGGSKAVDLSADGRPERARPAAWREVLLLVALFFAYSLIRQFASDDMSLALGHARSVLDVERSLDLDWEAGANQAIAHLRWAEIATSFWYASLHYVVTPVVLVLLYRHRPQGYRRARTGLTLATAVALVGYLLYPTAPPRLMPGYTDVLLDTSDVGWWSAQGSAVRGAATVVNQLAAMPSMHVGWALWCGIVLAALARHRWQRVLAMTYPLVTTLVVLVTANHWVLDAVVGGLLVLGALAVVEGSRAGVLHARRHAAAAEQARRSAPALAIAPEGSTRAG